MSSLRTAPLEEWCAEARSWLERQRPRRTSKARSSIALFHDLDHDAMQQLLDEASTWQQIKYEHGYGALGWPVEFGGANLPGAYVQAFADLEAEFETPDATELVAVSLELIAPTILKHGTTEQHERHLRPLLRADLYACQLFSEPDAGSDLAALTCRAIPQGTTWEVTGQKVWTSGAAHAALGLLVARTDTASKHGGLTAFLVPLDAPGISVRPIRQMSGGACFNEVFLDGVVIDDTNRLDAVGQGWRVARTVLDLERASSGAGHEPGGGFDEALALARSVGATTDPQTRHDLARLYEARFVQHLVAAQVRSMAAVGTLGVEGSVLKLLWVRSLMRTSDVASRLAGAHLTACDRADTTSSPYEWTAHVLGAPGYRIAGGSDEIQRNIIADRLLGLPREPSESPRATHV